VCGVFGSTSRDSVREVNFSGAGVYGKGDDFGVFGDGTFFDNTTMDRPAVAGVFGLHSKPGGRGVMGVSAVAVGTGVVGVSIQSDAQQQSKFADIPDPADGDGTGVFGSSGGGVGVRGSSGNSVGVFGISGGSGPGVDPSGVIGTSDTRVGVTGSSGNSVGVFGISGGSGPHVDPSGVIGTSDTHVGVSGSPGSTVGVFGISGQRSGPSVGIAGVLGTSDQTNVSGIAGSSAHGYGGRFAGGLAPIRLDPANTTGHPKVGSGLHLKGELFLDNAGMLFLCVKDGDPGGWVRVLVSPLLP
jgi:hypothetical protein